jgi:PIN domain nuclease of toxin-antitoxin system
VRLLLDTNVWLWSLLRPIRLNRNVTRALRNPRNELWWSPVSGLELISLCKRKRFHAVAEPVAWITSALRQVPLRAIPVTTDIALECARFELPHDDPADRILVATARVHALTFVTSDQKIIEAGVVPVLAND